MAGLGEKFFKSRYKNPEDWWRSLLSGNAPAVPVGRMRNIFKYLPAERRCKFCNAPFDGHFARFFRLTNQVPSRLSPTLCQLCEDMSKIVVGGAEIELTLVFADVRGSTALAETMSPTEYANLISKFFAASSKVMVKAGAWVEALAGDQVSGIFIPGFVGPKHASIAIEAAKEIQRVIAQLGVGGKGIGVGVGVHTGLTYMGAVGTDSGATDITVLGDIPNTTARLCSAAATGEILVSKDACTAVGLDLEKAEIRHLELKGKSLPVCVLVLKRQDYAQ
jgi:adenylate cyclase